jgi:periplasmic copper chaperone A
MRDSVSRSVRYCLVLVATMGLVACEPRGEHDGEAGGGLVVEDAWVRPARNAGTGNVHSAAYFTLRNRSRQDVRLSSVEAEVAEAVEIHESIDDAGVVRMRPVATVEVPARGSVAFQPGGLHVMLLRLRHDLVDGDSLRLSLVFEDGARVEVPAVVRSAVF